MALVKLPSDPISMVSYSTNRPIAVMREPYFCLFCLHSLAFLRPSGVLVGIVKSRILRAFRFSQIIISGLNDVDTSSWEIVAWGGTS